MRGNRKSKRHEELPGKKNKLERLTEIRNEEIPENEE